MPSSRSAYSPVSPAMEPFHGINPEHPVMIEIIKMVRDEPGPVVKVERSMEIVQNEESRKPEVGPPERIWDPRIEIIVIRRRGIICNYGRALIIIVVVYDGSFGILSARINFMGFAGRVLSHSQIEIRFGGLHPAHGIILTHR